MNNQNIKTDFTTDVKNFLRKHNYTSVNPQAALCDMDGTLYDSMPHHADAWKQVITAEGIECTRDEFFLYEGRTGASTINLLFNRAFGHGATDDECKRIYHAKTEAFKAMSPVDIMPGAQSLIQQFVDASIAPVLVTGSGQASLLDKLNSDYNNVFPPEMRVTAHDVKHGKPHPEPYLMALKKADVEANCAIALENAPLGVQSAADAGVFTIAVVTGPIPREAMIEAGAAVVFDSMPECDKCFPALLEALKNTEL
jgi:HAD superfamily hydrolase (TIGR01509 family)